MLRAALFALIFISSFSLFAGPVTPADFRRENLQRHGFQENKGQVTDGDFNPVPFVLFKQQAASVDMYITERGLTYSFLKCEERGMERKGQRSPTRQDLSREGEEPIRWERVDMTLVGADIRRENVVTEGKSGDYSQFFLGHCPNGITDVHTYESVTIRNVYPNIDWVLYNSGRQGAKYDFVVHPGGDPSQIQLLYSSRKKPGISDSGSVIVHTAYGELVETAPKSFLNGLPASSSFKMLSQEKNDQGGFNTRIGFDLQGLSSLGAGQELVIDPQLYWATFFGGTGYDGPRSVCLDNAGNVYMTGYTESANFPMQNGGGFYQGTSAGGVRDIFIQKFDNLGARLWATYYGGNQVDETWSVAVDNANNIFVFGYSESANFPTQNAGTFFQAAYGGQGDAVILKFNSAGVRQWATYYGGVNMEEGFSVAVDPAGNIWLAGETRSTNTFPLQNPGGGAFYQGTFGTGVSDAFMLKFDNNGNRLWATYAGGWNTDMAFGVACDPSGNAFYTGHVWGGGYPLMNSGTFYQGAVTGSGDIFITKFSSSCAMLWSTYYGGGAVDEGNSIACDKNGNVFICGSTAATNFPTQNPGGGAYFKGTKGGSWDTYMLKFDNLGNRLWATYFGGSGDETTKEYTYDNLAIDACGNVYMTFETTSSDVPILQACDGGYYDNSFSGGVYDLFITQFSNSGVYMWGTYWGGDGDDFRSPVGLDKTNNLFISGEWTDNSPMNPATYPITTPGGAYSASFSGGHDGHVAKFIRTAPTLSVTAVNAGCGCTGSATANPSGICAPYFYQWSNGQTTQTISNLCAGTYSVNVYNNICGTAVNNTVTITSAGGFTVTPASSPAACLAANGSATVTATGGATPYTYAWSPTGGTNSVATGLASGNYTVVITDNNGCSSTTTLTITSVGGPTATLANQTNILCFGVPNGGATITVNGGTSPYTYAWSPAGGTNASATGLAAGTYTINVTDANGCISTETVTITQPPALTSTMSSTAASCGSGGGSASVAAGGGTGSYTYLWNPTSSTAASISGASPGLYTVTVTDANGCSKNDTITIASLGGVTANATNATICAGQTATLNGSGGTNYVWSNGQSTSSISVSPTATTTYSLIVSTGSCSDTTSATVTISPPPAASAGGNQTVCTGSTVTLSANGGGTYLWNTGQSGATITATPTGATTYSVLVTSAVGCTNTATVSVFVTPSIVANAGPGQTICPGLSATLSASGGTGYSWSPALWLNNPSAQNPVSSPGTSIVYTVTVTSGSCAPATATVSVTVNPGPVASAAGTTSITAGQNATLTAGGGGSYVWSNGDTSAVITVTPAITTVYCVTVTDALGCNDSACVVVYIEPTSCSGYANADFLVLPSAFSPNGDGQNDKWRMLYSVELADCIDDFYVAVYNRWGEMVFEGITLNFSWDGRFREKPENTAVYGYYVEATFKDGTKIKKKGNVSLLR